nr:hypothetical protein [Tanacetum cinerariifolium]
MTDAANETPHITTLPPPQVTSTISPMLQTTPIPTPIPTPIQTTIPTPPIIIVVPEITPLIAVQLRVSKLEQDVSELKKIDHSNDALASIKSQVPIVVDQYLGTKLDDALHKVLQRHVAELIQTCSGQPAPESSKKQESEKTLLDDEEAMDKEVADTVKDHKRNHDGDDDDDDDEGPSARPNQGKITKRRRTKMSETTKKSSSSKELSKGKAPTKGSKTSKSASAKEHVEEPIAEVIMDEATNTEEDSLTFDDFMATLIDFSKYVLNRLKIDNLTQDILIGPVFNLLNGTCMATPIDFSKYVLNRIKIDNLTQDILIGPAFNLLKGTCSSSIELEYKFQECFNTLINKLDWNNPERDRNHYDLTKPLPLQGESPNLTVAANYFFNNHLEYLKSFDPTKNYATSITKTKAARYEIKGIEDMVPTLWSTVKHEYDKDAEKGIKRWGERQKLWYRSRLNKFSKTNVYSTQKILSVVSVKVERLHGYGYLEEIVVKRADRQKYKFKEGDFIDLHLNDIEDMLLLAVQHRNLTEKLNITAPQKTYPGIEYKELYTPSGDPTGIVYEDLDNQPRLMRANELYKFSDGTLQAVRDEIHHRIRDFSLEFNKEMPLRKWSKVDVKISWSSLLTSCCLKEGSSGIWSNWLVLENLRWTTG